MKWYLYAISLIYIAFGSCIILYTSETRSLMRRIIKGIDRRIFSVVAFIAGVLFIFAAPASRYPGLIRFFGLMGVVKGIFVFLNPDHLSDRINSWFLNSLSDQTYRFYGIIVILLGTAILSWIL